MQSAVIQINLDLVKYINHNQSINDYMPQVMNIDLSASHTQTKNTNTMLINKKSLIHSHSHNYADTNTNTNILICKHTINKYNDYADREEKRGVGVETYIINRHSTFE